MLPLTYENSKRRTEPEKEYVPLVSKLRKEVYRLPILDLENLQLIAKRKVYSLTENNNKHGKKYGTSVGMNGKSEPIGRAVWILLNGPIPEGLTVDHKDRNPHNNRPSNLRLATRVEQSQNRGVVENSRSGTSGVTLCHTTGQWRAKITYNKVTHDLGRFTTMEAAIKARHDKEDELGANFHKR